MLLEIGWNERDILDLYGEEAMFGISALMEGLECNTLEDATERQISA